MQFFFVFMMSMLIISTLNANPLRREKTFDYTPSYFIYPLAGEVPGLGSSKGVGATINNMGGSDVDFTGVKLWGDFDVSVLSLLNIHILKERLVLDIGTYEYDVAAIQFDRGQKSDPDNYIIPFVEGKGSFAQLTLNFYERMFEFYIRGTTDKNQVKSIYDKDGTAFANVDTSEFSSSSFDYGILLDFTDHRYDPRKGFRLEGLVKNPKSEDDYLSSYYITDINFTGYIPVGKLSSLAFNYYMSDAHIIDQESTNYNELKQNIGLNCEAIPSSQSIARQECLNAEDKRIKDRIAMNKYGRATPLGGSQRLGSYENARFTAGHSRFMGTEFRWNVNNEKSNFNYLIMKGVRTGLQLAAFAGVGSVSDKLEDIDYNIESYGLGARLIFEGGTVFRCDWATGNEGDKITLFVDYPWGLNPVDNSTR